MQFGLSVGVSDSRPRVSHPAECGTLEVTCPDCCQASEARQRYSSAEQVRAVISRRHLAFNLEGCRKLSDPELETHAAAASKRVFEAAKK